jgi:hypothetical protein
MNPLVKIFSQQKQNAKIPPNSRSPHTEVPKKHNQTKKPPAKKAYNPCAKSLTPPPQARFRFISRQDSHYPTPTPKKGGRPTHSRHYSRPICAKSKGGRLKRQPPRK